MKYRFRVPRWIELAIMFAACYLVADALIWALCRLGRISPSNPEVRRVLLQAHEIVLCVTAFFWTFRRGAGYHPAYSAGYLRWLRTTPWQPGMALPLGSPTLGWGDGIVLAVLVALAHWHLQMTILAPIVCFCCGFVVGSLPALASTFGWAAYVIVLGLAFVLRALGLARIYELPPMFDLGVGLAVGLAAWTQIAIQQSLSGFPWEKDPATNAPEAPGWLSMIPRDCKPLVSSRTAIATCVLIAIWAWSLLSFYDTRFSRKNAIAAVFFVAAIGALIRFTLYCGAYMPPISLLRRVVTGRLVIPGYDYAMLAPAGSLVVAGVVAFGLARLWAPPSVIVACGVGLALWVLLVAPPTFRNWQLTGFHRRVPFARS